MTPALVLAAPASGSSSALTVHAWHAVEAVGFLVISLVGVALSERARRPDRPAKPAASHGLAAVQCWLLVGMAIAGVGAAAVHYVVMPTHFGESALYGAFFLVAATSQLGYSSLLVLRPSRPLIIVGVLGNVCMVALWLTTRLVSIPLGPAAGSTETFGGLDILASAFEVIVVVAGLLVLARAGDPDGRAARRGARSPMAVSLAVLAAVAVTATACAAPPS